jgi:hypothetical protein
MPWLMRAPSRHTDKAVTPTKQPRKWRDSCASHRGTLISSPTLRNVIKTSSRASDNSPIPSDAALWKGSEMICLSDVLAFVFGACEQ